MTKQEAFDLFGGKAIYLARALEISRSSVSEWPDPLTPLLADRVIGAHVRHTKMKNGRLYTGKPVKVT